MVFGLFILIFLVGFVIIGVLGSTDTVAVVVGILYGVSVIGALLYVIIEKLDKILSIIEKD